MAIHFKPVPRKNPARQGDPPKYYAQTVSTGDMTLRQLAKQVAAISTVNTPDTLAVIGALLQVVPQALAEGKIVRLGDFGSISLSLTSEGMPDATAFTGRSITRTTIKFRAGKEHNNALADAEYHKLPQ